MDATAEGFALEGRNGNAFGLLGAFADHARQSGRSQAEIDAVLAEPMSGDYRHMLRTLADAAQPTDAGQ
jgi:hypothetical protein